MNRSSLERNQLGCWIRGSSATITSSAVIGNGDTGIYMETGSTKVTIDRCTVTDNAVGIRTAGPMAVVALISNTIITHNTTGVSGGLLWTRLGDSTYVVKTNTLSFNGTDGAFTNTFTAK